MKKKLLTTSVACCIILFFGNCAYGQDNKSTVFFLTKFADYIQWPASSSTHLIGVYQHDEVLKELEVFVRDKSAIEAVGLASLKEASNYHVVYLPKKDNALLPALQEAVKGKSVLIVSEDKRLVAQGADIGLFMDNGRMSFVMKKSAIQAKNLTISNRLLNLGKVE